MRKTLYVARVGLASDLGQIEDLFVTVADVQSQRLELILEASPQPYGVFEMSTEQDASDCLERFHGSELNGKRLTIVSERPSAPPPEKSSKKKPRAKGR